MAKQLDFSINYKIRPELQATFQVLNVLDRQRKDITRIPGLGMDLPTNVLELERRAFLGLRLSL